MNFSVTIISLAVGVIATALKGVGLDVVEQDIETFVLTGVQIISAIGIYWGRYRVGDINFFGKK